MRKDVPVRRRLPDLRVRRARRRKPLRDLPFRQRALLGVKGVHAAQHAALPAAERDALPRPEEQERHPFLPPFGLFFGERQGVALGAAARKERTGQAERRGGHAHRGAQLHQALREVAAPARGVRGRKLNGERLAQLRRGARIAQVPREDAHDVSVHRGRGLFKGDGSDRARRVLPHPGEFFSTPPPSAESRVRRSPAPPSAGCARGSSSPAPPTV